MHSNGYRLGQWRVFHRGKVIIAYPAFMRKDKMNALFLNRYYSVFLVLRRAITKLSSEVGCGDVTNPK